MTTPHDALGDLVRGAHDRDALGALIAALGFRPELTELPSAAWPGYGLARASAEGAGSVAVSARDGAVEAVVVEMDGAVDADVARRLASDVRRHNIARSYLFVFASHEYREILLGTFGLGGEFRFLRIEPARLRPSELDALEEMAPTDGESGLQLVLRHARALDRSRVTRRFFREFRAHRDAVADAWTGVPPDALRERKQLALLFLSRLVFLSFLQRRGALAGDDRYLARLVDGAEAASEREPSTYIRALRPLFFEALNRRPGDRRAAARALGALPYLNGGLFERHTLERDHPNLDLPDPVVGAVLTGLLDRYRFTTREAGEGAGYGVDPEMLGRVFEGLMEQDLRGDTGSFYTPAPVVQRVVREALSEYVTASCPGVDGGRVLAPGGETALTASQRHRVRRSLERIRVLDPACGSGAFLVGALHHLGRVLERLAERPRGAVRRDIVARSLHGVDLLDDAALLCSLRLWLALSDDRDVQPLPNLDRRIRQGDALVDPLDLGVVGGVGLGRAFDPLRDPCLRDALRAVEPAARRYLESGPHERDEARRDLARAERRLGRRWIDRLSDAQESRIRELAARAADRDLFGDVPEAARAAAAEGERARQRRLELAEIGRALEEDGALPFFSFGVHFADAAAGFDVIVSNPPWVRIHRWPDRLRRLARRRYRVCREPGWAAAAELTGAPAAAGAQVDLSLLFVERALGLLAPDGVLAVLVPAKALRALYGAPIRRMLLSDLVFNLIEDHALDHRSIFRADAFAAVLVGRRRPTGADRAGVTRVRLVRRGIDPLEFVVRQRDLPLFPDDPASPWMLAPRGAVSAFRTMQAAGDPLGRHAGLRVRRGVMTGANRILVLRQAEPKLGDLCSIEAEGFRAGRRSGAPASRCRPFRAVVETSAVRPLVRGADIDAFRFDRERHVVWSHDADGRPVAAPPRLQRYLRRHRAALEARHGWRPPLPLGTIFRLSRQTLAPKVAWHDLSDTLRAVALPSHVPFDGRRVELVPLNTVYFLPLDDPTDALLIAALLNSLPLRTFARAVAERAKDARFRFFAWVVSSLPLPADWRDRPGTAELVAVSKRAHDRRGAGPEDQQAIDRAAAAFYRLSAEEVRSLTAFDQWLKGIT